MKKLGLGLIEEYIFKGREVEIDIELQNGLNKPFEFLEDFSKDRIIYGINTGFGPMVQFKIEPDQLNNLQYNLIRSHSTGLGEPLAHDYAKGVLLARLNNFLQGNSGVSAEVIEQLLFFLQNDITPEIPEHGGVGASGDLVQLAHLGLNLIGEGNVFYKGEKRKTDEVLKELNRAPLALKLRDGLGIINGTSCMSAIGAINLIYAKRLLKWAVAASSMINEVTDAYDDSFSKELNEVKLHFGQNKIAEEMREFLFDSKLIRKREELFKDNEEFQSKRFKNKIQSYYSLRCVPQILGPVLDTLNEAEKIVINEINSTNDNPIVSIENDNVFHGGNFHGDYISLEMDKVKIVVTKLTMLIERQLNYLMNDKLNTKFPPFINAAKLGLNFGYQGMQFTATSTTAENQTLSNPMYVHSIPNNNDNQDIVSMGTNSALITKKVIENGFQVMAIHIMALCHTIEIKGDDAVNKVSSNSKKIYDAIRAKVPFFKEDSPMSETMQKVVDLIKEKNI